MALPRSVFAVCVAIIVCSSPGFSVPITVDLRPSDQLHIVQGSSYPYTPPATVSQSIEEDPAESHSLLSTEYVPSRVVVSEGSAFRAPPAEYASYGPQPDGRDGRDPRDKAYVQTPRDMGHEDRASTWRQGQDQGYGDRDRAWYPRHGQMNGAYTGYREHRPYGDHQFQQAHPEVWDNSVRRPQQHVQQQQPHAHYHQHHVKEERRQGQGHNHDDKGSHICVDGKCFSIQTQAYEASTASDATRQRPAPPTARPAEPKRHQTDHISKRSTDDSNEVRKRYQPKYQEQQYPQQQPQGYQYQQAPQMYQGPEQSYQQQAQPTQDQRYAQQQPQKQYPTSVPQGPQGQQVPTPPYQQQRPLDRQQQKPMQGQGYPQQGQFQERRGPQQPAQKPQEKVSALTKAVMDFDKVLDMADEFSYVLPIMRNYDDIHNILVIELDYSEAPNTAEATVETED